MGCGCSKNKDPSVAQAKRTASRLEARAVRQEAMRQAAEKFRAEKPLRQAQQQRRPTSG